MKVPYLNLILLVKILLVNLFLFSSCAKNSDEFVSKNPDIADKAFIDRFNETSGILMVRTNNNGLPQANEPILFDNEPFITQSFGPNGQIVRYYNFDVQSVIPAPIYVLFKFGSEIPIPNQLNIMDLIPGDPGYSDFWQVYKVYVPDNYVANAISSYQELLDRGFNIEKTNTVVNCPVVPYGSIANANLSTSGNELHKGWYKGKIAYYFTFDEKSLQVNENNLVPVSPIYVTFNINPDENNSASGPASGFVMENGSNQTHNIIATIPSDTEYSPLWSVKIYDNNYFDRVFDLETVLSADILVENAAFVNCPVVYVE